MNILNKIVTRQFYTSCLSLLIPFLILRLLVKSYTNPNYRKRIGERFGIFSAKNVRPGGIWVHAVSVGETIGIAPVIQEFMRLHPNVAITITTTTPTGSIQVKKIFTDRVFHVYCPFDLPYAIKSFLDKIQPKLCILMETEIWPNIINLCQENNIYTILANARLSEKSRVQYAKLKNLTSQVFNQITCIAAQSSVDANRYIALGTKQELITITGSVKFDMHLPEMLIEQGRKIKQSILNRQVILAASTHKGEEEYILAAYKKILQQYPAALLLLVPRHIDRCNEIEKLIINDELFATKQIARKSANQTITTDIKILLGDTMGEMYLYLAIADLAIVGGSFVPIGGHNVLEPAALGLPVITGEYLHNFAEISSKMLQIKAMTKVANSQQLAAVICNWLGNPRLAHRIGQNGKQFVVDNKGSIAKLIDKMEHFYAI
jgi:3-deoxy-D-manno-octulosonic-acid transferase